ncbi:hypothetical protein HPB50_009554 [Hyalomma asiaticum]|uniref:Uncharacterized protein n=1 Tax=Hyalomma asiaticum TaxID=266040 RepID=A0ACB7THP9_HYAAI|nr:hypothetical protein HPB50_009554 [Hyalomma asiaticum]
MTPRRRCAENEGRTLPDRPDVSGMRSRTTYQRRKRRTAAPCSAALLCLLPYGNAPRLRRETAFFASHEDVASAVPIGLVAKAAHAASAMTPHHLSRPEFSQPPPQEPTHTATPPARQVRR